MTLAATLPLQFTALLTETIGQLVHFVRLLEAEQACLTDAQTDALLQLAADKSAAVRQLQAAENSRALLLARHGIDPSADGVNAWVAEQADSIRQHWARYLDLVQRAHELNALNGRLIRDQLKGTQQALAVLLAASGPALYGADGQPTTRPAGRLFGRA